QIPVCTVRPFHSMSRGSPTFTDSSRAMVGSVLFGQHLRLRFSVRKETRLLALRPGGSLLRATDRDGSAAARRAGQGAAPPPSAGRKTSSHCRSCRHATRARAPACEESFGL